MENNLTKIILTSLLYTSVGCSSPQNIMQDDRYAPCRKGLDFVQKLVDAAEQHKGQTGERSGFILNFVGWSKPPSQTEMDCIGEGIEKKTDFRIIFDTESGKYWVLPKDYNLKKDSEKL